MNRRWMKLGVAATILMLAAPAHAAADPALAKRVLLRSVAFKTVEGEGQVPKLADYYASVLKDAGFADADITITPIGETATLAATLKGSDPKLKPLLMIGHMDVVAADRRDWTRDPFVAVEENGYIFGRGAEDNKYDVAMMVTTLAQLKRDGFKPRRTVILLLSGDEETQMATTRALAQKYKNAELLLNGDGGGGLIGEDGKPALFQLQAGEKTYADFEIAITDAGGHSSAPTATNPIYRLAKVLDRIASYQFAPMANELTRASMRAGSRRIAGEAGAAMARYAANPQDAEAAAVLSSKPELVGQIRTTCVATMLSGGHALNALPQRATVSVNCRIFPGVSIESVKAELTKVIADDSATITTLGEPLASDASPLRKDVIAAVTKAVQARYPGLEVTPSMISGATDSLYFRASDVPSYGVSSLFQKASDGFAHGLNERVPVDGIPGALQQWDIMLKMLSK
ncbi:MAG: M20/M25/M40 family metallo-hydrolase [Sphingobium sp.]|uniref:M20/M25/M40 family metallo-hydrolase n=1 Tax=Sphingobium sp. TaxID=1912891 RepID=UPI0029AFB9B1|nr:M20/M25/M40 family metallo-hydrolase [Sphingobium sp.]MDX3909854.1 M20/M25/M40 family metallo-hydrolase [Sphingobium sp.]